MGSLASSNSPYPKYGVLVFLGHLQREPATRTAHTYTTYTHTHYTLHTYTHTHYTRYTHYRHYTHTHYTLHNNIHYRHYTHTHYKVHNNIWYFRAPERADRRVLNHWSRPVCCVFGAPQTSPPRISALAGISEPQRGPTGGYGIIVSPQDLGHSIGQSASQSLAS